MFEEELSVRDYPQRICFTSISPILGITGMVYIPVGLAGVSLPTLASDNSKSLTKDVCLPTSPGIVRHVKRLILCRWKKVCKRDAIESPLDDGNKLFRQG